MSAIFKIVRRDHGFTQVDNETLRDDRLTFRARGVLAYLLSMEDGWRWDSLALADASPGEGRDAIRTALRELEVAGYLRRTKQQDDAGRWVTVTEVHETPIEPRTDSQASVQPLTEDGSSDFGSSGPKKKNKEEEKEPSVSPKRTKRQTQVPEDFEPDESALAWQREHCPLVSPRVETPKFVDYHLAKGTLFRDWQRAWRNWMRNARPSASSPSPRPIPAGPVFRDGSGNRVAMTPRGVS